jgi:hypothetical protein
LHDDRATWRDADVETAGMKTAIVALSDLRIPGTGVVRKGVIGRRRTDLVPEVGIERISQSVEIPSLLRMIWKRVPANVPTAVVSAVAMACPARQLNCLRATASLK